MQTVKIQYFGVEGSGRNVTEAKRDAGKQIERALSGDYSPIILEYRGNAILVWRDPMSGWRSGIIFDNGEFRDHRRVSWSYCHSTKSTDDARADAIASAQDRLAQLGWRPEDATNPPEFLKTRQQIADYRYWAEFQLRYSQAKAAGMPDNDAHDYAGKNPARPELWAHDLASAAA